MKPEARGNPSSEHEPMYHAAGASLSLTPCRLHDVKKTCSVEGQKTGGFASQKRERLSSPLRMKLSSLFKGAALIGANVASICKSRIWFSRSTNGGAKWESPRMINNQASLNDQYHPRLAVDELDGKLVVVYYDTVSDPARLKTDIWMQFSYDDGENWSSPMKVTTAQTDETSAGANLYQYGDYIGLSGYAGKFFPSWTDRRSGGKEEIWTAMILLPNSLRRFLRKKGIDPGKGLRSIRPPITSVRAFMGI